MQAPETLIATVSDNPAVIGHDFYNRLASGSDLYDSLRHAIGRRLIKDINTHAEVETGESQC
jgi:hypothetical protein